MGNSYVELLRSSSGCHYAGIAVMRYETPDSSDVSYRHLGEVLTRTEGSDRPGPWSVMVVDDRSLPRLAARAMLAEIRELRLVAEAGSGREALELYPNVRPDIVLLDVQMPDLSGPDTARRLLTIAPELTIVAWSVSDDTDDLLRMMQAGCAGYVLKDVGPQEMGRALLAAVRGDAPIPRHLVRDALRRALPPDSTPDESPVLSPRELEILRALARAHPTKEIAADLSISRRSVETHLRNIYRKLDVRSRGEAVNRGLRLGILSAADL